VSGAAAAVLTSLFGADYHFTTGSDGLPGVTRSFGSFDAAAAEAGQSRIYGGIHYQFDNQGGLAAGHALGQFVVGNFLLPAEGEHEEDGRDDDTGGRAAFPAEGLALLLAGPGNDSATNRDALGGPAIGQPRQPQSPQPLDVLAATSVDLGQPSEAWHWLAAPASDQRVLDPALAGRNASLFSGPLPSDEVFAWAS
jgi:hypothetical protein